MAGEGRIGFKPTDGDDLAYVTENIRPADLAELQAVYGAEVDVKQVLFHSVGMTRVPLTAILATGEPVAVFGVASAHYMKAGVPWLIATPKARSYARELIVHGRKVVEAGLKQHGVLFNFVDARNTDSVRWLKHIGFTIENPSAHGVEGSLFHLFHASLDGTHEHMPKV